MLKSMREGAKSAPMKIFLITLAIGFAMWGIDDVFRNVGSNNAAIKAGNYEVSALEAAQEFDRARRTYLPNSNNSEAIAQGLLGDVISGLARRVVFSAEADRQGLTVTREMEKAQIANEAAFQDETGKFNLLRFRDALARAGLDEASYVKLIQQDLNARQITDAIRPGLSYPSALSAEIAKWRLERRIIDYVTINIDASKEADPSGSELDAWYATNKEAYNSPDLRSVMALVLSPEDLMKDIDVSDADIRQAYDDQIDLYTSPERRTLRQMILPDVDQANDALARIKGGESFASVAKDLLSLEESDTLLGALTAEDLTEEIAQAAFATEMGNIAGPVKTALGQHLLLVEDIEAEDVTSFDNIKDQIREDIQRDRAITVVYDRVADVEDAIASGATLSETAKATGAELVMIDGMDRSGNDIDGVALDGIAGDTKFRQSVWTAVVGEMGLVEETNADTFYVIEVTNEAPSAERPLADIKPRVIADYRLEQAVATAMAKADTLIEDSASLANAARTAGLSVEQSPAMRRDGVSFDHEAARLIAGKAFDLGANAKDLVETGENIIVIAVTDIQAVEGDTLTEETDRIQNAMSQMVASGLDGVLATGLIQEYDVTVNAGLVQNLLVGQSN